MAKKKITGDDGKEYSVKESKPFYKKWWFITAVVVAIFFIFFVDSGEEPTIKPGEESTEVIAEEETAEEEVETSIGKRSNPVPIGETVEFNLTHYGEEESMGGKGELTINSFERGPGVYDKLVEINQYNEEAPEGYEWALVNLTFKLTETEDADEEYYVSPSINVYDSEGTESPVESAVVDDEFGWVHVYEGGTSEGYETLLVPADEDDVLINIDDSGYNLFFNVK